MVGCWFVASRTVSAVWVELPLGAASSSQDGPRNATAVSKDDG